MALLFKHWLVWYRSSYGSLRIVMATFFWIMLPAHVLAAAFAPRARPAARAAKGTVCRRWPRPRSHVNTQ